MVATPLTGRAKYNGHDIRLSDISTVLPAKTDSDVMFSLQSYHGHTYIPGMNLYVRILKSLSWVFAASY